MTHAQFIIRMDYPSGMNLGKKNGGGEQGWRSGEINRLPPMWPGFDSRTRGHIWVEFVVGSHLCSERFSFSGYSGIPLSSKTNNSKLQFGLERLSPIAVLR